MSLKIPLWLERAYRFGARFPYGSYFCAMSAEMPPKIAAAADVPPLRARLQPEVREEPLKQKASPRLNAASTPAGSTRSGSARCVCAAGSPVCHAGAEYVALAPPPPA